jgi:hypothetical protein
MSAGGMRSVAVALAIVAVMPGRTLAGSAWRTLTGANESFTIEIPGESKYTAVLVTTASGEEFLMHLYLVEVDACVYAAQTAVYPPSVDVLDPRRILPKVQLWFRSAQDWVTGLGSIPQIERQPAFDAKGGVA